MTITIDIGPEITQTVRNENLQVAQDIANAAQRNAIANDQFVFFAAFDGTNNDQDQNLPAGEQSTNVWELINQITQTANLKAGYFPGPGTSAALRYSSWLPFAVTQQVIAAADSAYTVFAEKASVWAKANPTKPVSVALTSFSRGDASAAIFSQMLYERGLIDPENNNKVLIPPGQVAVSAGVIFDPVTTGVSGNLAFAPNTANVVVIKALNEYRNLFEFSNYAQSGISTYRMYGNHGDIGGGYDNGTGAISLQAATDFFTLSGMDIGSVAADRVFNETKKDVTIHSEEYDNWGHKIWDVSNLDGFSRNDVRQSNSKFIDQSAATGSQFTLYNGNTVTISGTESRTDKVEIDSKSQYGSQILDTTVFNSDNTLREHDVVTKASDGTVVAETITRMGDDGTLTTISYRSDQSYCSISDDGHGTSSSDYFNAAGNKISDSWTKSDGAVGQDTYYLNGNKLSESWTNADGSVDAKTYALSGAYTVTTKDANGNQHTDLFTADGVRYQSTSQEKGHREQSTGYFQDHVTYVDFHSEDGSVYASQTTFTDGSTQTLYRKDAEVGVKTVSTKLDGSYTTVFFTTDGSTVTKTTVDHDPYGAYKTFTVPWGANDGNALSSRNETFGIDGGLIERNWANLDGSEGHEMYYGYGPYICKVSYIAVDGSGGTTFANSDGTSSSEEHKDGNSSTTYFSEAGIKTGDSWWHSDGSNGSETFWIDGTLKSEDARKADGSSYTKSYFANQNLSEETTDDGHGNSLTVSYSDDGILIKEEWRGADGIFRESLFGPDGNLNSQSVSYADGSSYEKLVNFDRGYRIQTNDGKGAVDTAIFSSAGEKIRDEWTHSDGSHGNSMFSQDGSTLSEQTFYGDGTVVKKTYASDGSYVVTNTNRWNDVIANSYNSSGILTSTRRKDADGLIRSELFNSDGSVTTDYWSLDHTHTVETIDSLGNKAGTSTYENGGRRVYADGIDGSHNYATYNPDGTISNTDVKTISIRADGFAEIRINSSSSGSSSSLVENLDRGGNLLNSVRSWQNNDGSYGEEKFSAIDQSRTRNDHNADGSYSTYFSVADNSYSGSDHNADGSYTNYSGSPNGSNSSFNFDQHGILQSSDIQTINSDGSSIEYQTTYDGDGGYQQSWNASDGSYGENDYSADGSTDSSRTDANGVTVNTTFDAESGSFRTETLSTDGSSSGKYTSADGSYDIYTSNGRGKTTTWNYDAYGIELNHSVSSDDGNGNTKQTVYGPTGTKLSDTWTRASGTTGSDTYFADGSIQRNIDRRDGDGVVDQQEALVEDASGAKTNDVRNYNPDGTLKNETITSTSADGLTIGYVRDANGDGAIDKCETLVKDTAGGKTDDVKTFNLDGTLKS